jgi:hypothetical protein
VFALIDDNFAIQYVGDAHLDHLCQAISKHYKVSEEIDGSRLAGMTLKWNYSQNHTKRSCFLSIPGYICNVSTKYKHPMPTKCQLSPHFGQATLLTHDEPYSPPLSTERVKRVQGIISALLDYPRAVNNKLLATLSTLSSQQATATKATNNAISQLLDYLATNPTNGTTYRTSNMILCAHADCSFYSESKGHSRASAHIFVFKNNPVPKHNCLVLSISQIMKFVMSSAAKAKLGALYTTTKKWSPLVKLSLKWVGLNHTLPSNQTIPLLLVSPTSPSSHKRPSPWTSTCGGSDANNPNISSVTTGIMAATIGQTTTPNTTHPSTTSPTDPYMQVQQAYYHLIIPAHSGHAAFY